MKVNVDGTIKNIHTLWREGSDVKLIDQRVFPHGFKILTLKDQKDTVEAIKIMILRGPEPSESRLDTEWLKLP
jgi:methylthioribose-1-phosphate isomerase